MKLIDLIFVIIFFLFSKIAFSSQWIEGNKLVIQGLDKITARIQTFEVDVGQTYKFGVLDIFVERCVFSKPIFKPESLAFIKIKDNSDRLSSWSLFDSTGGDGGHGGGASVGGA